MDETMKTTKRLLAFAMILALLVCLGAPAFAEEAQYTTTKAVLKDLADVEGFKCEVKGIIEGDDAKYEMVSVSYEGDLSEYKSNIQLLFSEDCEEVQIYLYNLINFAPDKLAEVLDAVNDINAGGTGVKLFVDKSDNSVTAEMYQILCENDASDLTLMALGFMIGYTDTVYESLQSYATAA